MTIASTVQQRLAGQLLDEQALTKEELSNMFGLIQDMLKTNMKDKDTITAVEVKALLEDAIDVIKVKPSEKKVSFGKEESAAYMNFESLEPSKEELPGMK
eukprot:11627706-Karenia_brevis.AAC.1